jgi:hypothetical protein
VLTYGHWIEDLGVFADLAHVGPTSQAWQVLAMQLILQKTPALIFRLFFLLPPFSPKSDLNRRRPAPPCTTP